MNTKLVICINRYTNKIEYGYMINKDNRKIYGTQMMPRKIGEYLTKEPDIPVMVAYV
jgi:hypothetical protein